MLRIGLFTDTFIPVVDGVGRVSLAYAETLCKMGHQVTVVAPLNDTGYRGGYPFELLDYLGTAVPGNRHRNPDEKSENEERMKMSFHKELRALPRCYRSLIQDLRGHMQHAQSPDILVPLLPLLRPLQSPQRAT